MIVLAGAVALLVAAPAPAKTVTVDISKLGFVPGAVSVQTGDSVTWTNKDTVNHQVVCKACPFTSLVLSPGQTHTFTFSKTGKFTTVDPLNNNRKGTVTVTAAPATLTLSAHPTVANYGSTAAVAGVLSTAAAGQKVDILAQPCGENAAKVIATAMTTTGGNFAYQAQPTLGTSYQARYKGTTATVTSSAAAVSVRPVVVLKRNGVHRFTAQVIAAQSFVGKAVLFQRWVKVRHRWSTVKTVFLGKRVAASEPLAASTASSVTFGALLRRGLSVRAVLPAGQAAPCYASQKSPTIRS
ncbi:MAG TPA: cupredoxin domain-containing protein [Gaiellaceae bacterium]